MSENEPSETQTTPNESVKDKLRIQNTNAVVLTLLAVLLGAVLYMGAEVIPMPSLAVGFFTLGFAPAIALVAAVGAIRGPLAGFLVGYFGEQLASIFLSGGIVVFSLYGVAFGVLGLIVGL
ncbi:MAG: hypothetical protein KAJ36_01790, partial [Candidatus Thorarchaeota archaeon]|nr:hypothetical protein [Candidatus Thorarchaeota archaeon]